MKKEHRLQAYINIGFIIFGVLFIAAIIVKICLGNNFKPELFITIIAGLITSFLAWNKQELERDQVFKDLFREFNKRFDELNENLNRVCEKQEPKGENQTAKGVIQDYLNLCSEEYLWYSKGRIDKEVWKAWMTGILYYLKNPVIKAYFELQIDYDKSYYGFISYILKRI